MVIDCVETFDEITKKLDHIIKELNTINHKNQTLAKKYHGDVKFARVHKRIREEIQKREQKKTHPKIKLQETKLVNILNVVKENIDGEIYNRNTILKNSAYFEDTVLKLLSVELQNHHIDIEYDDKVFIQRRISEQYLQQYNDNSAA